MTSDEQQPEEKKPTPTRKFGSIKQYETIGGGKGTDMPADTLTQERLSAKTLERQNVQEMKRQTVYMPKRLAAWLKVYAAAHEDDISGIITRLVEDFKAKEEGDK